MYFNRRKSKPKSKTKEMRPDYEAAFLSQIRERGLPEPVREYRFIPNRRYRFDFAWVNLKMTVEIEGGTWSRVNTGRHTRGSGFQRDCIKYNTAALLGWKVFRFPSNMILSGQAISFLEDAFSAINNA
jgi:very-short-patch-repair endonuclease